MKIGGLILAAGMSSRMGDFKPMLDLSGYPLIDRTILSMQNANVAEIAVVLGNGADRLRKHLKGRDLLLLENPDYKRTDMLRSIKYGLVALWDCDAVFILPGDIPAIHPRTYHEIREKLVADKASIIYPLFEGNRVHPTFLLREHFAQILSFDGDYGLKGALASLPYTTYSTHDAGTPLDADTPADFDKLAAYVKKHSGISRQMAESFYDDYTLPANVIRHAQAVTAVAMSMAKCLIECNVGLDTTLVESGALLHDIKRLESNHGEAGAALLRSLSYDAIAKVIADHMHLGKRTITTFDESTVVLLADRFVKEDRPVTIDERYRPALAKYKNNPEIRLHIRQEIDKTKALVDRYKEITHEDLYEQCRHILS